jgi:hypothetical protein
MRIHDIKDKAMYEVAAMTTMYLEDGIFAYCTCQPRCPPEKPGGIWQTLWLSGWDHAQALDAYGDELAYRAAVYDPKTLTEAIAELDRAKILAWRDRHTLTAIDGQLAPAQRLAPAAPDVSR